MTSEEASSPISGSVNEVTSSYAARLLAEAREAFSRQQLDVAERAAAALLAREPDHAEAHRLMGFIAVVRGESTTAIEHLQRACTALPNDASIWMTLGSALFDNGAVEEGLTRLQQACALAPRVPAAWYNLGRALQVAARIPEAQSALQKALALAPTHIKARITLADVSASLGDTASAASHYREVLRQEPAQAKAWFALANLKTEAFAPEDAAKLRQLFQRSGMAADTRVLLGFALAKALDDQKAYAAAFDVLRQANDARRLCSPWDQAKEAAHVESITRAFGTALPRPLHPSMGEETIFIVSLPRSGSTLLEQILASHPASKAPTKSTICHGSSTKSRSEADCHFRNGFPMPRPRTGRAWAANTLRAPAVGARAVRALPTRTWTTGPSSARSRPCCPAPGSSTRGATRWKPVLPAIANCSAAARTSATTWTTWPRITRTTTG